MAEGLIESVIGEYDVEGMTGRVYKRGENTLMAYVSGQPEFELVPFKDNKFTIKGWPGYSVEFKVDDSGKVTGAVASHPGGVMVARKR
ncbi:MAG: hypothetical protein IT210_09115 [Armatimonadetes bacterium]|nr:hypothetical protein [Armatimonadota bacterium]